MAVGEVGNGGEAVGNGGGAVGARMANAALGLWLFVSAFLWPHGWSQQYNALVVGMVVVTAAVAAIGGARWGRYVNAASGGWLIISALFLSPGLGATFWNHVVVGFLLATLGLSPSLRSFRRREPVPP
jgi:hypothetical protein